MGNVLAFMNVVLLTVIVSTLVVAVSNHMELQRIKKQLTETRDSLSGNKPSSESAKSA